MPSYLNAELSLDEPLTLTDGGRDPLLHSERTQGFAADPDYWKGEVFAYVGRNQSLKDLKDHVDGFQTSDLSCGTLGLRLSVHLFD